MSADRDRARAAWIGRLGPLYPALLTLRMLSALPLPESLRPRREDLDRCVPWLPLVGALLGGAMAAAAGLLRANTLA